MPRFTTLSEPPGTIEFLQEQLTDAHLEMAALRAKTIALSDEINDLRARGIPEAIRDHEHRFMMWGAVVGVGVGAIALLMR